MYRNKPDPKETTPSDTPEACSASDTGDVVSPPTVRKPAQLEPCDDSKTGTVFASITETMEDLILI